MLVKIQKLRDQGGTPPICTKMGVLILRYLFFREIASLTLAKPILVEIGLISQKISDQNLGLITYLLGMVSMEVCDGMMDHEKTEKLKKQNLRVSASFCNRIHQNRLRNEGERFI